MNEQYCPECGWEVEKAVITRIVNRVHTTVEILVCTECKVIYHNDELTGQNDNEET